MTEPFIGEICQVGFAYAPRGWAFCDGSLLSIRSYPALYAILGTRFGGDGKTTFGLPDLRGRFTVGAGQGPGLSANDLGETGGSETVTLTVDQMPAHTHRPQATNARGDRESPSNAIWAQPHQGRGSEAAYAAGGSTPMHPQAFAAQGGGQPHNNMPPFQVVNFVIALEGVFPQRP